MPTDMVLHSTCCPLSHYDPVRLNNKKKVDKTNKLETPK